MFGLRSYRLAWPILLVIACVTAPSLATAQTYVYFLQFGGQGSGNGQFQYPNGSAVDKNGNVYVVDQANSRIEKFTSNGSYLSQWGSTGSGNGQFLAPTGIAVDTLGNVYVTDTGNHRVQKFTTGGFYLAQWGTAGSGPGQFTTAYGIAVDVSGNVYVSDNSANRVQRFSGAGAFLTQWGSGGTGNSQFDSPSGIAVDPSGHVFVADQFNHRVQKFDMSGAYLGQWGSEGAGDGQFEEPLGVALDVVGDVYVADSQNQRVQKFSGAGAYLTQFGTPGSGNGQLNTASGVAVDASGLVYVTDTNNHRAQKFGAPGQTFTSLDANPNPSVHGQSVTLTATVAPPGATGLMNFYHRTTLIGTQSLSNGSATLQVTTLPVGADSIRAVYQGGTGLGSSTSNWVVQTVFAGSTFTTIASDFNPSGMGQVVTFTAAVGIYPPATGQPTGSVQFLVDGVSFGAPVPLSGGVAARSTTALAAGSHNVVAVYTGDAGFSASGSPALNQVVFASQPPPGYVTQWGSTGSADGQFLTPESVASDAAGNIYVLDLYNARVQRFSSGGTFVLAWGGPGAIDGKFQSPKALAVSASGFVYVTDAGRIQEFDGTGAFLGHFGDGQVQNPTGIAVDGSGFVYVADTGHHRIIKYSSGGTFITQWGSLGSGAGQFQDAVGVAATSAGFIYVTDRTLHRVQKFDSNGAQLLQWGGQGDGNGQFQRPYGIAVDTAGRVYVGDDSTNRVQKFTSEGVYLSQLGSFGSGNGEFDTPLGINVDRRGFLYVADSGNQRIQVFSDQVGQSPRILSVTDVGVDQGRQVRVRFRSSSLDAVGSSGPSAVYRYDVLRRIDQSPSFASASAPEATTLDGWDAVGSSGAYGDSVYNIVVPTLSDSNSTGTHRAVFFVRAVTGTIGVFYDSATDSGYSLDNLAPAPPAPFTASYAGGATALHWSRSGESDFYAYRLYRASSAGFTPGPSNLVVTKSDTGYVDPGPAGSFYKLSALDWNGNESAFALVTPYGTTDVPEPGAVSFGLESVRPNPARATSIHIAFALPAAAPARLELIDVSGRRVLAREVGTLGAGRHELEIGRGERIAAGLYLVRLTQGANVGWRRVAVIE
jgi:sugar lactone lactonase YvrE